MPRQPDSIDDAAELVNARPQANFTLHFTEDWAVSGTRYDTTPIRVMVKVAGIDVGSLALYEVEWAAIWRALVNSAAPFERQGIELLRTGPFR